MSSVASNDIEMMDISTREVITSFFFYHADQDQVLISVENNAPEAEAHLAEWIDRIGHSNYSAKFGIIGFEGMGPMVYRFRLYYDTRRPFYNVLKNVRYY